MTGIERLADIVNDGPYSGGMIHISVQKLREICEQIEREVDVETVKAEAIRAVDNRRVELCAALGIDTDTGWSDAMAKMVKRLMPEGMEWPKYTDGSLVEIGDEVVGPDYGERFRVDTVTFHVNGFTLREKSGMIHWYESDDRFERPAPKVLDADGVEIRVGDTVYLLPGDWCDEFPCLGYHGGEELEVFSLHADHVVGGIGCRDTRRPKGTCYPQPSQLTHRTPVIAADGKPLEVGQTVYHIADGKEYTVEKLFEDGAMVTHDGITGGRCRAEYLTHERPESWERLEADAGKNPFDYCKDVGHRLDTCENSEAYKARDLVRRCKAFAERDR